MYSHFEFQNYVKLIQRVVDTMKAEHQIFGRFGSNIKYYFGAGLKVKLINLHVVSTVITNDVFGKHVAI